MHTTALSGIKRPPMLAVNGWRRPICLPHVSWSRWHWQTIHVFLSAVTFVPPPGGPDCMDYRRRHNVPSCPFILPFVCLSPNLWTRYVENEWTDFDANWQKWSTGQGHETVNFGGQTVKDQGHTRSDIDLSLSEAWLLDRVAFLVCDLTTYRLLQSRKIYPTFKSNWLHIPNKCIGDDTKAAALQSLNCIKNKK